MAAAAATATSYSSDIHDNEQLRNDYLIQLSQHVVDGRITYKLDFLATIYVYGLPYFTVFRRYNSVYNIVVEDMRGDIYLYQEFTPRQTIRDVLCLTQMEARHLYTRQTFSYKHNGPIPSMVDDVIDLYWTDIQYAYGAVKLDISGIRQEFEDAAPAPVPAPAPSTPQNQMIKEATTPPPAPQRPKYTTDEMTAANTLLSMGEGSRKRKRETTTVAEPLTDSYCYCGFELCGYDVTDADTEDDEEYIVLRSGTRVPKQ